MVKYRLWENLDSGYFFNIVMGIFILLVAQSMGSYAQVLPGLPVFSSESEARAFEMYKKAMNKQELVYNGSAYLPMKEDANDHPFFLDEGYLEGTINCEGHTYVKLPMKYDIVQDELIVPHYDQQGFHQLVQLRKEKVNWVLIEDHYFIYVAQGRWEKIKPGYYNVLYDNDILVLEKIEKEVKEELSLMGGVDLVLTQQSQYFLIKDNQPFLIKNRKSLIKAFGDHQKILAEFINNNNYQFKSEIEAEILNLVKYYVGLDQ